MPPVSNSTPISPRPMPSMVVTRVSSRPGHLALEGERDERGGAGTRTDRNPARPRRARRDDLRVRLGLEAGCRRSALPGGPRAHPVGSRRRGLGLVRDDAARTRPHGRHGRRDRLDRLLRRSCPSRESGMPLIRIEIREGWLSAEKSGLLDAIHAAAVEALRIPDEDRTQILTEHPADAFEIPPGKGERFTLVEITMFAGRSLDAKRHLYRAVVRNLGRLGIPPSDVLIALREVALENWGIRGGTPA